MDGTRMFAAKEYREGRETLFAACDEECLGEHYREGSLSLRVDAAFYDGGRIGEEEFALAMRRATIANFVGERAVGLAIDLGFVSKENVIRIDGVPHAQWALMMM